MPSPATLADQGLKAFNSSNYPEAINFYSQALQLSPETPDYYLKRSIAHQRSGCYDSALHDAECAVMLANCRGKRELIGTSQLRRGIALHLLGKFGDADFCFKIAEKKCGEKDKNMLGIWQKKVQMALEKCEEEDVAREVTVEEIPEVELDKPAEKEKGKQKEDEKEKQKERNVSVATPPPPPEGVTTPASKIRHEWYQTAEQVVLTLYVKGVPKEEAVIDIEQKTLSISFPLPSGNDFVFDVDPLWDNIVPAQSSSKIYGTKVEITLKKSTPGKKWADLEGAHEEPPIASPTVAAEPDKPSEAAKPVYPTSSKKGPKDWDKLAQELTAKPKKKKNKGKGKEGEGEEGEEAEYDSDYEGGDPVNYFFKKLYKDADEDTRRAMMKSYVESNGTALSTNWKEVGQGKVETSPPEGMVAKHWDE